MEGAPQDGAMGHSSGSGFVSRDGAGAVFPWPASPRPATKSESGQTTAWTPRRGVPTFGAANGTMKRVGNPEFRKKMAHNRKNRHFQAVFRLFFGFWGPLRGEIAPKREIWQENRKISGKQEGRGLDPEYRPISRCSAMIFDSGADRGENWGKRLSRAEAWTANGCRM